jgi:hypothetical protein
MGYLNPSIEQADEYLRYEVFLDQGPDYANLGYGVTWQHVVTKVPSKLRKLGAVVELGEKLAAMGFEEDGFSMGYRYLREHDSMYELLSELVLDDAEALVREASCSFCSLIKKTRNLLIMANQEIIEATGKRPRDKGNA